MDRRTVLRSVGVGVVAAAAGCAGGEIVHEQQRQVRVDPGGYWVSRLPAVGGSGAISFTVRAEARFDVYVFTAREHYDRYLAYHEDGTAERTPTGHEVGTSAVYDADRDRYAATSGDGGSRDPFDTEATAHFVVDHSRYGMGAVPDERADVLRAFVDLEVISKRFGL